MNEHGYENPGGVGTMTRPAENQPATGNDQADAAHAAQTQQDRNGENPDQLHSVVQEGLKRALGRLPEGLPEAQQQEIQDRMVNFWKKLQQEERGKILQTLNAIRNPNTPSGEIAEHMKGLPRGLPKEFIEKYLEEMGYSDEKRQEVLTQLERTPEDTVDQNAPESTRTAQQRIADMKDGLGRAVDAVHTAQANGQDIDINSIVVDNKSVGQWIKDAWDTVADYKDKVTESKPWEITTNAFFYSGIIAIILIIGILAVSTKAAANMGR